MPSAASQVITVMDDKARTFNPKHQHKSCIHRRHKKHEHNSASHSPPPEKLHPSHSSRKKPSSKAKAAACKGFLSPKHPVITQGAATPSTSGAAPLRTCKTSGDLQFASSRSFQAPPILDNIKRHQGAQYVRAYCHKDNLYACTLDGSPGASSGEDEPDPMPSSGYPCPSFRCHSKGAIYQDNSDPESSASCHLHVFQQRCRPSLSHSSHSSCAC